MKKQVIDQSLHFLWSLIALAPIMFIDNHVLGGLLSGLFIGLPRELIDQWPIGHWKDTVVDLIFFAWGGAALGALI